MGLNNDEPFPAIAGAKVGGGRLIIPNDLSDSWNIVLVYRGHW